MNLIAFLLIKTINSIAFLLIRIIDLAAFLLIEELISFVNAIKRLDLDIIL